MPSRSKEVDNIFQVFNYRVRPRDLYAVGYAIFFFTAVLVVLWLGQGQSQGHGEHNTGNKITLYSNKTLPPIKNINYTETCTCPTSMDSLVYGMPTIKARMGQTQRENNTPYTLNTCMKDAYDMLQMMQDGELRAYVNTLTHRGYEAPAPKQLYYSWDQDTKQCNFYFECEKMKMCSSKNVSSGIVNL